MCIRDSNNSPSQCKSGFSNNIFSNRVLPDLPDDKIKNLFLTVEDCLGSTVIFLYISLAYPKNCVLMKYFVSNRFCMST